MILFTKLRNFHSFSKRSHQTDIFFVSGFIVKDIKKPRGDVELQPSQTHIKSGKENNKKEELLDCTAHIKGTANLQDTAHICATVVSTPQQALWPICMHIDNEPHQTFRETIRSYGLATSTHITALDCRALVQSLSALSSGSIRFPLSGIEFRKLNPGWGQKVTKQCERLNWYLVPFFVVHRICVPYGMWGLKTQNVIQPERTMEYLTVCWGKEKHTLVMMNKLYALQK